MPIVLDGTNGISTPDVDSAGPISGTTGTFSGAVTASTFSGAVSGTTGTFSGAVSGTTGAFSGAVSAASVQAGGIATNIYPLVSATAVASTSGTSIDFTGVPSWAKRVTVVFNGVSTNGTSNLLLQVGSGSITTSGYTSGMHTVNTSNNSATTGFGLTSVTVATTAYFGHITLSNFSGNIWISSHVFGAPAGNYNSFGGGTVTLAGALDRLRITTVNGTDTFDAGTINIMYE